MYSLYIGNKNYSSWSLRPWLLLTELGIPFDENLIPFEDGGSWEKFRAFSPTGLVPCLVDGEQTVWESLGITEYVAEAHPQVWPADSAARAWARSATAEMHAGFNALRNECPMNVGLRIAMNNTSAALTKDVNRLSELWEQGLDRFGGPFLAGSFIYRSRCIFRTGRLPYPNLRSASIRCSFELCTATASAGRHAGMDHRRSR